MDSFKELIVKKLPTKNDNAKKFVLMLGSVALAFAFIFFGLTIPRFAVLSIFFGCCAIYGGIYLIQNLSIEYEYIFTNGEMDVDKIIAQRNRKRLVTVKFNSITAIGKVENNFSVNEDRTLVYAADCNEQTEDYYVDFSHKDLGNTTLVFTPDDDLLRTIKPYIPRNIRANFTVPVKLDKSEDDE